jgi:hypothetical protein
MLVRAHRLLLLVILGVGCSKQNSSAEGAPVPRVISATVSATAAAAATSTAAPSATASAAASTASYTYSCAVKPTEIYLSADAKRAGPRDPDPTRGEGEATFTLTTNGIVVTGSGTGALGAVWVQGSVDAGHIVAAFGPAKDSTAAFRGTLEVNAESGGTLHASSGLADSARAGQCTRK